MSLIFFVNKNILRINKSEIALFPKTAKNQNEYIFYKNENIKLLTPINNTCYFSQFICSHEIPSDLKVNKINGYYILMQ